MNARVRDTADQFQSIAGPVASNRCMATHALRADGVASKLVICCQALQTRRHRLRHPDCCRRRRYYFAYPLGSARADSFACPFCHEEAGQGKRKGNRKGTKPSSTTGCPQRHHFPGGASFSIQHGARPSACACILLPGRS